MSVLVVAEKWLTRVAEYFLLLESSRESVTQLSKKSEQRSEQLITARKDGDRPWGPWAGKWFSYLTRQRGILKQRGITHLPPTKKLAESKLTQTAHEGFPRGTLCYSLQ